MKKTHVLIFLAYLSVFYHIGITPSLALTLPIYTEKNFSGDVLGVDVSGIAKFNILEQSTAVSGEGGKYLYLTNVVWLVDIVSHDSKFSTSLMMQNGVGISFAAHPYDIQSLEWNGNWMWWECWGGATVDRLTSYNTTWTGRADPSGPAWNLLTNENYLPMSVAVDCYSELDDYLGIASFNFRDINTPIPEPGTLIILCIGLVGFAAVRCRYH
jgi:hypothetical protein